jgi:RecB family endonuclease NucS
VADTGGGTPAPLRSSAPIGKIERVPLREVWRHEAHNLTTWLEENIDVLTEVLDFGLSNVEREQSAGSFSADLVAEDDSGGIVVIENQLERSNHDQGMNARWRWFRVRGVDA